MQACKTFSQVSALRCFAIVCYINLTREKTFENESLKCLVLAKRFHRQDYRDPDRDEGEGDAGESEHLTDKRDKLRPKRPKPQTLNFKA